MHSSRMRTVHSPTRMGVSLDRDPPGTEGVTGQRLPFDTDPLDRDPSGQNPPDQMIWGGELM